MPYRNNIQNTPLQIQGKGVIFILNIYQNQAKWVKLFMAITKQQLKVLIYKAFQHDKKKMSYRELCEKYEQVKIKTGIDVWNIENKGKNMNRYNINVLGGNSGGGRTMAMYKSGHAV